MPSTGSRTAWGGAGGRRWCVMLEGVGRRYPIPDPLLPGRMGRGEGVTRWCPILDLLLSLAGGSGRDC